jgi:low temperature requirement protein LtrA
MAGLFVCALAIPHAFDRDAVAFGLGYLAVVLLHGGRFIAGYGGAVRVFVAFRIVGGLAIIGAGVVGAIGGYGLWISAIVLQYLSSRRIRGNRELFGSGLSLRTVHFVERHGLLLIVAFGESVVGIGVGLEGVDLGPATYVAAVLGLVLVMALWWTYFAGDDEAAVDALQKGPLEQRLLLANRAYFYAFLPMLLGIVVLAAGVALTIADVNVRAEARPAILVGCGAALYLIGVVDFRRALGLGSVRYRVAAIPVALSTVVVGVVVSGLAQTLALVATLVSIPVLEGRTWPVQSGRSHSDVNETIR